MGLVYANHDFTTNFLSAVGVDDEFMKTDIIIDEIGRIIATDKNRIVKMLRDCGVDASYSDDPVRISELVKNEIINNDNFTKKLSKYIINTRTSDSEVKNFFNGFDGKLFGYDINLSVDKLAGDNKESTPKTKDDRERSKFWAGLSDKLKDDKTKDGVTNLLSTSISNIFGKKDSTKSGSSISVPTAGEQLTQRVRQNDFMNLKKRATSNNTIWWVIGGVLFLGAGSFLLYKLIQRRKYEMGGEIHAGGDTSGTGGDVGFDPNEIGGVGANVYSNS